MSFYGATVFGLLVTSPRPSKPEWAALFTLGGGMHDVFPDIPSPVRHLLFPHVSFEFDQRWDAGFDRETCLAV